MEDLYIMQDISILDIYSQTLCFIPPVTSGDLCHSIAEYRKNKKVDWNTLCKLTCKKSIIIFTHYVFSYPYKASILFEIFLFKNKILWTKKNIPIFENKIKNSKKQQAMPNGLNADKNLFIMFKFNNYITKVM